MTAGGMFWHPKETTHYLGDAHYIVVRPAALDRRWLVEESTGFEGSRIHSSHATRAEADLVAEALAATPVLHVSGATS